MGRAVRNDTEGGWHHVMNRGAGRQRTFFHHRDGLDFERLLGVGCDRFGVEIHAYCLMPNHFHLLVHCPHSGLGTFVQHVVGVYTRHVNERLGRDGALFRGRYRSVSVIDDRHLLNEALYIHRNPRDLQPPTALDRYRWSSHGAYVGTRRCPTWLVTDRVLDMFSGGRAAFHDVVDRGSGEFLADCPPHQLLNMIDLLIDESDIELHRARQGVARTIGTALIDLVHGPSRRLLIDAMNLGDDTVRSRAQRRAHEAIAASDELQSLLKHVVRRAA